ncbi:MAG: NAD-dependent epimerase/dehydratase family protein [Bryobacterales bacterium]|nr:NAD-dependent epimerase/dehydratase family protein [Bryobacterales bacterium]
MKRILVTGGAGFVGSHVTRELLKCGYSVRVLDNLTPQVHGPDRKRPNYLDHDAEFIQGDVRDAVVLERALSQVDAVYHFAALVGVGQSMYQISDYTSVNNYGTAQLLECLIKRRSPVERLVVASSMSIYGEGLYANSEGKRHSDCERNSSQLRMGEWELRDSRGSALYPIPTDESKPPSLISVYALSKFDQERMCLAVGRAYQIPVVALRFFNIYGPHQALSNPYTGVLAIFASRLLNGKPPLINEDGLQQRDFVSVYDIARACRLALTSAEAPGSAFNIGSGKPCTIRDLASRMGQLLGTNIAPQITGKYRTGDIRHCFADITKARNILGYEPQVELEEGLEDLAKWLDGQAADDHVAESVAQLTARGLMV